MQRKYDHLPENIGDIKSVSNLQKWIPIVTECCNSGQSKKSWCEERGIDVKSYFYYQKKVYNLIKEPASEFVELPVILNSQKHIKKLKDLPSCDGKFLFMRNILFNIYFDYGIIWIWKLMIKHS